MAVPARFWIAVMIFLTTYINYTTRSNMSSSITAMVRPKKPKIPYCKLDSTPSDGKNKSHIEDFGIRYLWTESEQGFVISAYFWGYVPGSLVGGPCCEYFGPFWTIWISTLGAGVLNALCPIAAQNLYAIMVIRLLIGFLGGTVYPALQSLIGNWAPPAEKGKFVSALMGNTLGTCLTWLFIGIITTATEDWAWGFYFITIQIAVFLVPCWFLLADSPEQHKYITQEEIDFIKEAKGASAMSGKRFAPYAKILTSFPFWILIVLHIGNLWGLYLQITAVPKFMSEFIGYNIKKSGVLSSTPHITRMIFGIGFGIVGDIVKKKYSPQVVRKSFVTFSHLIPGLLMLGIPYAKCNWILAVVLLVLSMAINGAATLTNLQNPQDLAPNFAGTLFGIMSFIGGLTGVVVPILSGKILDWDSDLSGWKVIFFTGGLLYFVSGVIFILFAQTKTQSWNEVKDKAEEAK